MMKILARAALVLGTIVAPIAATAVTADAAPMQRDHRVVEGRNERPAPIQGQYQRGYKFQGRRAINNARLERNRERGVMLRAAQTRGCDRKF